MRIVDVVWTPKINMMVIQCACGRDFQHRADRWHVKCPFCHAKDHLRQLRDAIQPGDIR